MLASYSSQPENMLGDLAKVGRIAWNKVANRQKVNEEDHPGLSG
jgi:hypothetical protein